MNNFTNTQLLQKLTTFVKKFAIVWVLASYLSMLLTLLHTLKISEYEQHFAQGDSLGALLVRVSLLIFGDSYARLSSIFMGLCCVVLVYLLIKRSLYVLKNSSRCALLGAICFAFSPGIIAASLLLDSSILMILCTLLLAFFEQSKNKSKPIEVLKILLLGVLLFINTSCVVFYIGALVYFHQQRKTSKFIYCVGLLVLSVVFYELDFHGKPRGYFLESLALCAAVFSPPLFLYYFYYIYQLFKKVSKDLLSYASAAAFLIFLILSFRQKAEAAAFLPLLPLAFAPMCEYFVKSYYQHVRANRRKYRFIVSFVLASLLLSDAFIVYSSLNKVGFLANFQ